MDFPVTNEKLRVFCQAYATNMATDIGRKIYDSIDIRPDAILILLENRVAESIRRKEPWRELRVNLGDLTPVVHEYNYHDVRDVLEARLRPILLSYFPTIVNYEFNPVIHQVDLLVTLPETSGQTSSPSQ